MYREKYNVALMTIIAVSSWEYWSLSPYHVFVVCIQNQSLSLSLSLTLSLSVCLKELYLSQSVARESKKNLYPSYYVITPLDLCVLTLYTEQNKLGFFGSKL